MHGKLPLQFSWVVAMSACAWSHPAASVKPSSATWHNLTQPGVTNQWTPCFTNYSNYFQIYILPLCSNSSQLSLFSAPYESRVEEREVGGDGGGKKETGEKISCLVKIIIKNPQKQNKTKSWILANHIACKINSLKEAYYSLWASFKLFRGGLQIPHL